jgi:aminocarboxymuconate-semialdehyde decarboxylase
VLAGTDYPYDMGMYDPRGFVGGASLKPADKAKILGGNAARLLKIKAPAASKAGRTRGRR